MIGSSSFVFLFVSALFLFPTALGVPVTSRPPSPTHTYAKGDYVGVRPTAYETKDPSHKKISIHPGIIVGDPHPDTGAHPVAMISKTPPFNPPQAPIEHFQTGTGIYGNVVLKARPIPPGDMKPWKDGKSGGKQTPLTGQGYQKLIKAMEPHVNWRPPTPPPRAPTPPEVQRQKQKQREAALAYAQGRHPSQRPNQHPNAHASGSRTPNHASGGGHTSGSWRSPNPASHSQQGGSRHPPNQQGTGHGGHQAHGSLNTASNSHHGSGHQQGHSGTHGSGNHRTPSNHGSGRPQNHGGARTPGQSSGYQRVHGQQGHGQQGHGQQGHGQQRHGGGGSSRRSPSPNSNANHHNTNTNRPAKH